MDKPTALGWPVGSEARHVLGAQGPVERFPAQPGAPRPASRGGEACIQGMRDIGQASKAAREGPPSRGPSVCRDPAVCRKPWVLGSCMVCLAGLEGPGSRACKIKGRSKCHPENL